MQFAIFQIFIAESRKKAKNVHKKPLTQRIQISKNICKFFKPKEKLKICQLPLIKGVFKLSQKDEATQAK